MDEEAGLEQISPAESIRRLEILATFFENFEDGHAPAQFDISLFVGQNECGTSACVAGWAGLIPEFQRLKLVTHLAGGSLGQVTFTSARGNIYDAHEAMQHFFGLSWSEARTLCYEDGYDVCNYDEITPALVAKRLRILINARIDAGRPTHGS